MTMARSRCLWGPYEVDPENPMLSSTGTDCELQRTGHGQYVSDPEGNWYMAHLCSRPLEGKWSILGREAAIQNIDWPEGGWPRIKGAMSTATPRLWFDAPNVSEHILSGDPVRTTFAEGIPVQWMTLHRNWQHCGIDLSAREGWVRIRGGNSLCSHYRQHLLARTVTSLKCSCAMHMDFEAQSPYQMAGLIFMYNCSNWYYLCKTAGDDEQPVLAIFSCDNGEAHEHGTYMLPEGCKKIILSAEVNGGALQYAYSLPGEEKQEIGPMLDMRKLSDEYVNGNGFTAAMMGFGCQDLRGNDAYADIAWFDYQTD